MHLISGNIGGVGKLRLRNYPPLYFVRWVMDSEVITLLGVVFVSLTSLLHLMQQLQMSFDFRNERKKLNGILNLLISSLNDLVE